MSVEDGILDYPTAWAIQKEAELKHLPNCSSVPGWHPLSGPSLLCDCGAVEKEFDRRTHNDQPSSAADGVQFDRIEDNR